MLREGVSYLCKREQGKEVTEEKVYFPFPIIQDKVFAADQFSLGELIKLGKEVVEDANYRKAYSIVLKGDLSTQFIRILSGLFDGSVLHIK